MPVYQLRYEQLVPTSKEELWRFISTPKNLSKITPKSMNFEILEKDLPVEIYAGMIIRYLVSPLPGYRTSWVTEITHVEEGKFFVDEQRHGPYSIWHHEHHLSIQADGVLMTDIITYKPPFGFLGAIANAVLIKSKINSIFKHRKKVLEEIFPGGALKNNMEQGTRKPILRSA